MVETEKDNSTKCKGSWEFEEDKYGKTSHNRNYVFKEDESNDDYSEEDEYHVS